MPLKTRYIIDYFNGEKQEAFVTMAWGMIALVVAYVSIFEFEDALGLGIAVPMGIVGGLHLIVGVYTIRRSHQQIKSVLDDFSEKMQLFKFEELNRMEKVVNDFNTYRLIAQVMFVIGVILIILGVFDKVSRYWCGIGMGLMLQGAAILFLDLFAELRAKEYYRHLSKD